jgi:hypothetical protein
LSKQPKDGDYCVTVELDLPKDHVHQEEIRLVAAGLGNLLKRVVRETGNVKE